MREAICIKDLSFSYGDSEPLFDSVNLDIQPGEKWAIIGPNASGKSTLVHLVLGLLKPDSGSVSVYGKAPQEQQNIFGYVPQKMDLPDNFPITVSEFVMSGVVSSRNAFGLFTSKDRVAAEKVLEKLDLSGFRHVRVKSLSGGNFQKALLARALITDPQILVLDEAFSNIDPRKENEVLENLVKAYPDLTLLLVTHDIGMVSHYIEKVACLNKNLVVHKTEALTSDVLTDVFGGQVRAISHKHTEDVDHKH